MRTICTSLLNGSYKSQVDRDTTAWQSKLWFFWAVIAIVYGTAAVLVWNKHKRQPTGNRQKNGGLTDRRPLER
jgi:tryptophan-rich sensory protein